MNHRCLQVREYIYIVTVLNNEDWHQVTIHWPYIIIQFVVEGVDKQPSTTCTMWNGIGADVIADVGPSKHFSGRGHKTATQR